MVRMTTLALGDSFGREALNYLARRSANPFNSRNLRNVILETPKCDREICATTVLDECNEDVPYTAVNLPMKEAAVWDLDNLDGLKSRYRIKHNCSLIYDNIPEESVVILFEDSNPRKRKMRDENLDTMDVDYYGDTNNKKKSRTEFPELCCVRDFCVTPKRKFKNLGSLVPSPKRFVSKVFMKMRNENNKRTATDSIQELEDNLPELTLNDSTAVYGWKRKKCFKL